MKDLGIENLDDYISFRTSKSVLKDSGNRQGFDTGAIRDVDDDKPRFDLIPVEVLFEMAQHYADGAKKYSDRNWEKGIPIDRHVASFDRHWNQWKRGDTDEPHLRAAMWNLMAIMHHEIKIQLGELPESLVGVFGPLAKRLRKNQSMAVKEILVTEPNGGYKSLDIKWGD